MRYTIKRSVDFCIEDWFTDNNEELSEEELIEDWTVDEHPVEVLRPPLLQCKALLGLAPDAQVHVDILAQCHVEEIDYAQISLEDGSIVTPEELLKLLMDARTHGAWFAEEGDVCPVTVVVSATVVAVDA